MAANSTFVGTYKSNVQSFQMQWDYFSRQIFHFLRSLQMQQIFTGGSPTYFVSVKQVREYMAKYLAPDCSERLNCLKLTHF